MQTAETMTAMHMIKAPDALEYVTIKQAADALATPVWAVVGVVESGDLRAVRFGALTLVSRYDVEQLGGGDRVTTAKWDMTTAKWDRTVPRWNRQQHPDPESPRRLHLTEHRDPAGIEEPCAVFVKPAGEDGPTSICLDLKLDLSPTQAREVGARLIELAVIVEADLVRVGE